LCHPAVDQESQASFRWVFQIKANLPLLEEWLAEIAGPYEEEDGVYRLYHQSYKVFDRIQPPSFIRLSTE
jgi:hypothetical protein